MTMVMLPNPSIVPAHPPLELPVGTRTRLPKIVLPKPARIVLRHSRTLAEFLGQFTDSDGGSFAELIFADGRLAYPARTDIEKVLGFDDPHTLDHESRVFHGASPRFSSAVKLLAAEATDRLQGWDPTLDLLWSAHHTALREVGEVSVDRLVAALVAVQMFASGAWNPTEWDMPALALVEEMHMAGMPPTKHVLSELGEPACVLLGLVDV